MRINFFFFFPWSERRSTSTVAGINLLRASNGRAKKKKNSFFFRVFSRSVARHCFVGCSELRLIVRARLKRPKQHDRDHFVVVWVDRRAESGFTCC